MTVFPARQAIVIGAGIGGLAAAAALSPHFRSVLALDRDELTTAASVRMGVGQGAHTHQLLKAGEDALERLIPGVTAAFYAAGAVDLRVGRNVTIFDFGGVMPECDAGFSTTSLSRPVYENVIRTAVTALPNVTLRGDTLVKRLLVADGRCTGVELEGGEVIAADLIVDASGMNSPVAAQLAEDGHAEFETESVKINVAYTTGRFEQPAAYRGEARGFFVLPAPPAASFGLLLPIENNQWILSLGARGASTPPRDLDGFRAYAASLPLPDIHDRIRGANLVGDLKTFRKTASTRRHFATAAKYPDRLVPLGDAMSNVNPTFGQGMSIAACQADALASVLRARSDAGASLDDIGKDYFPAATALAARAWGLALNSDYTFAETEGPRPASLPMSRAVAATLRKLAADDVDFRILRYKLGHMIEPDSALRDGPLALKFFTALQGSMAAG